MLRDFVARLTRSGSEQFSKTGTVDHPNVVQSEQGRYFVGRTGLLRVERGQEGLVIFRLPRNGRRRAFVVSITVTANQARRAFFYFGAQAGGTLQNSAKIAITHRGMPDEPQAKIEMGTGTGLPPSAGVAVFERLLVGGGTLVLEQQGRVVLEPGEGIAVRFPATTMDDEIDVALGWWEEPLR